VHSSQGRQEVRAFGAEIGDTLDDPFRSGMRREQEGGRGLVGEQDDDRKSKVRTCLMQVKYQWVKLISLQFWAKDFKASIGVLYKSRLIRWAKTGQVDVDTLGNKGNEKAIGTKDVRSVEADCARIHIETSQDLRWRRVEAKDYLDVPGIRYEEK
jgi:hypothetical protein